MKPKIYVRVSVALAMALIGALVYLGANSDQCRFRLDGRCAHVRALASKIELFLLDTGQRPRSLDELFAAEIPQWAGPYARASDLIDISGEPIRYEVLSNSGVAFRLSAVSKDGSVVASETFMQ